MYPEPVEPVVAYQSREQAERRATVVGGVAGGVLGGGVWLLAAKIHPVGRYLGAVAPVLGAVAGARSWRNAVRHDMAVHAGQGRYLPPQPA